MLCSSMTFDEWARHIEARVLAQVPGVNVKRKTEDLCRWIHAGKECQVHAVSDSVAAFAELRRNGIMTDCSFSCHTAITPDSEEEVVTRIIGWLAAAP